MTSVNISLPEAMRSFIEAQVASGGFGTTSEYIRQLIREAQTREAERRLEATLIEGLQSGRSRPVNEAWFKKKRAQITRRSARNRKS